MDSEKVKISDAEIKKVFGNNLNLLRRKAGLSRQEFAEKFNVSVESVGGYERGARIPALPNLFEFADYFNVSVDELLGRGVYAPSRNNAVEEYRLQKAIQRLSTVGKVVKHKRGEFVLAIPVSEEKFVTDSEGVVRRIKGSEDLICFGGALDLVDFTESVIQIALDSNKTFKEVFNEKTENLFTDTESLITGKEIFNKISDESKLDGSTRINKI